MCVFHLFTFIFHLCLPNMLSRLGFERKLDLMSLLRFKSHRQVATCSYRWFVVVRKAGRGAAHSKVQGQEGERGNAIELSSAVGKEVR